MQSRESSLVAINGSVAFFACRIQTFHLYGSDDRRITVVPRDDVIKALVPTWEVDVPARVCQKSGHVHFSKIVAIHGLPPVRQAAVSARPYYEKRCGGQGAPLCGSPGLYEANVSDEKTLAGRKRNALEERSSLTAEIRTGASAERSARATRLLRSFR
jgi:hypothetical protein